MTHLCYSTISKQFNKMVFLITQGKTIQQKSYFVYGNLLQNSKIVYRLILKLWYGQT